MLVLVRYNDNNFDIVEEYCLEYLIVTGKVVEFSRADEWVRVGMNPTREKPLDENITNNCYSGPDRRGKVHANLLHNPAAIPTA